MQAGHVSGYDTKPRPAAPDEHEDGEQRIEFSSAVRRCAGRGHAPPLHHHYFEILENDLAATAAAPTTFLPSAISRVMYRGAGQQLHRALCPQPSTAQGEC